METISNGMLMLASIIFASGLLSGTSYNLSRFIASALHEKGIRDELNISSSYVKINSIGVSVYSLGVMYYASAETLPLFALTMPIVALRFVVVGIDLGKKDMDRNYTLDNKRTLLDIGANIAGLMHIIALTY